MSFTTEVKNELCELELSSLEVLPFLSGYIRNNLKYIDKDILLTTENPKIARRVFSLLKGEYDVNPEIKQCKGTNFNKKNYYNIELKEKVAEILKDLNVIENNKYLDIPKEYFLDSEDQIRSYLRGVFLATGSINDPKTSRYHLEFFIEKKEEADFLLRILKEFNILSKCILREKKYMVYVKEAEKIGDFLRLLSVNRAVMYYEDIRIYRDHKNMTNRLNNCEQANVDKIIASSEKQINDINTILDNLGYDFVGDKIKDVMEYRVKYPEASLEELSEIITYETNKPITKSGLNHRLRKIHDLAESIKNKDV